MLKGMVSFVTGGASGLGKATVEKLVSCGGKVITLDIQGTRLKEVASKLENVIAVTGSVTSEDDVKKCLALAQDKYGRLDSVVNCAGISVAYQTYNFHKNITHRLEDFTNVVETNAVGTFNVIRLSVGLIGQNKPDESGQRGVIINTSSTTAYEADLGQAAIAAASAAINGMTLPIARDLSSVGIRVVTIAPGLFDTPLLAYLPDKLREFLARMSPHPSRLGRPEEYAKFVTAVLENRMLNGEVIRLDAGFRSFPQ